VSVTVNDVGNFSNIPIQDNGLAIQPIAGGSGGTAYSLAKPVDVRVDYTIKIGTTGSANVILEFFYRVGGIFGWNNYRFRVTPGSNEITSLSIPVSDTGLITGTVYIARVSDVNMSVYFTADTAPPDFNMVLSYVDPVPIS
jgi:hypothetical protein